MSKKKTAKKTSISKVITKVKLPACDVKMIIVLISMFGLLSIILVKDDYNRALIRREAYGTVSDFKNEVAFLQKQIIKKQAWDYKFGPNKNTEEDFYDLMDAISEGAEVKLVGIKSNNTNKLEAPFSFKCEIIKGFEEKSGFTCVSPIINDFVNDSAQVVHVFRGKGSTTYCSSRVFSARDMSFENKGGCSSQDVQWYIQK